MFTEIKTNKENVFEVAGKSFVTVEELISVLEKYKDKNVTLCGFNNFALYYDNKNDYILLDNAAALAENNEEIEAFTEDQKALFY